MKYTEKVKNFLDGEVFFKAENGFSELFLDTCRKKGIILKHTDIKQDHLFACVRYSDYLKVNEAAFVSGMDIALLRKKGLPEIGRIILFRFGIPVGIFLAFVLFCFFSGVVWSVEVSGCESVPAEAVLEVLEQSGIRKGSFVFNADCAFAEDMLMAFSEKIYAAAVNISGCRVFVDIVENTIPEKIIGSDIYSNITASRGGEILKADIFAGESELKPGDAVVKGDLLVSGVTVLSDGSTYFCDSKAAILARTVHNINCSAANKSDVLFIRKARDRYSPFFFGVRLLPGKEDCKGELSYAEHLMDTKKTVFPLGIIRQRETEFEKEEISLSPGVRFLVCFCDLSVIACEQLSELKNAERKIKIVENDRYSLEAEFICEEDICEKQFINIFEQN